MHIFAYFKVISDLKKHEIRIFEKNKVFPLGSVDISKWRLLQLQKENIYNFFILREGGNGPSKFGSSFLGLWVIVNKSSNRF